VRSEERGVRREERAHTFPIEYITPFFLLLLLPAGTPNIVTATKALSGTAQQSRCKVSTKARWQEDGNGMGWDEAGWNKPLWCHTARLRKEMRRGAEGRSANFVLRELVFVF
jgi:hypothetical protein